GRVPTQWTLSLNPLPPSRTANTPACVGQHLLGALRLRRPRWALTPPASTRALAHRVCPSLDDLPAAVFVAFGADRSGARVTHSWLSTRTACLCCTLVVRDLLGSGFPDRLRPGTRPSSDQRFGECPGRT